MNNYRLEAKIRVTVSGSFNRHLAEICLDVANLEIKKCEVLSPKTPCFSVVENGFLFIESDLHRSIYLSQEAHFQSIKNSDFLWIVCPDRKPGISTSLEVGFALANRIPIFTKTPIIDKTISTYIKVVDSIDEAILYSKKVRKSSTKTSSLLIGSYEKSCIELSIEMEKIFSLLGKRSLNDNEGNEVKNCQERILKILGV